MSWFDTWFSSGWFGAFNEGEGASGGNVECQASVLTLNLSVINPTVTATVSITHDVTFGSFVFNRSLHINQFVFAEVLYLNIGIFSPTVSTAQNVSVNTETLRLSITANESAVKIHARVNPKPNAFKFHVNDAFVLCENEADLLALICAAFD